MLLRTLGNLAISLLFFVPIAVNAQCVSITTTGIALTENFDTLASTGTSSTLPTGWQLGETLANANAIYTAGTGSSTTGDSFSFGSAASSDRALGGLRSGSLAPLFGACYTNNTGTTITSLDIAYTGEQWRLGTAARTDQLNFQYSIDATSLATGIWNGVAALNFVTPTTATIGAKDGNATANRTALSASITSLSIPNGTNFWIRWTDTDATGADDGLAVDDFSLTAQGAVSLPLLTINDVSLSEGNAGTTSFTFTVNLSSPAGAGGVTFDIAAAPGTATPGSDYVPLSLTGQTIPSGNSTYTFTVLVNGDTSPEANETFFVNVTNVVGANVIDGQGLGTIVNDDAAPDLSINDITLSEGDTGTTTFTFTVSLSAPAPAGGVTFDIATADGTAQAGSDYVAKTLTGQTIPAGSSTYTFDVIVNGDTNAELTETFFVNLSNVTNAIPLDSQGLGTIVNDDAQRIHTVQGSGTASPFAGQPVTVEGIVTAVHQGPSTLNGFFIQEPDALIDADPLTSEGIFVYTNLSPAAVSLGQLVRVTGNVTEFGTAPNTLTEIVTPTVSVLSSGNPLPAVTIVNLPVTAVSDFERYEGMRVQFAQTLAVSDHFDLAHFGEVTLTANGRALQPSNEVDLNDNPASGTTSSGTSNLAALNAYDSLNVRSSIILDDASSQTYPAVVPFVDPVDHTLRLGSTVNGLTGVFSQSFGAYRVYATTPPAFNYAPRPATPPSVGGNLKVASANVLNYFNGNGATGVFPTSRGADSLNEFNRQRSKVIAALTGLNADVIGLLEIQNNANHATPAVQDLINGLNAIAGAGTWAYMAAPANYGPFGASGLIPGGSDEIRPAIIYKPAVVAPVGISTSPNDPAFNQARAPIAQTFRLLSNNEQFTLVINHFKSKGSGGTGLDADLGDGQAFYNNARKLQAAALVSFIGTLTASGPAKVIAMGDFNAYEQEDPIDVMRAGGLSTIINNNYSYMFNGLSGSLDHALGTPALMTSISGAGKWHINADEPVFLDYNVETKNAAGCTSSCTTPDYFTATPFRASDHDPVLVGLQLIATQTITFLPATGPLPGVTWTVAATASSGLVVSFSSGSPAICSVSGSTVTFTAIGTCIVNANQAGNADFSAAPQVTQNIVHTGAQTITFVALGDTALSTGTLTVGASATSSLLVTFASQTATVCTTTGVNGSLVTLLKVGTCTVRASQGGNALYAAAAPVDRSFNVLLAGSSLSVTSSANPAAYDAPVTLTAAVNGVNATGRVTFSVVSPSGLVTLCDSVSLVGSSASCAVPGKYQKTNPVNFRVSYTGDANNVAAVVVFAQQVTLTRATLSVSVAPVKPFAGRPMKLTALVYAVSFSSKVTFRENGAALAGCADIAVTPLPGVSDTGVATCTIASAVVGQHDFVVTYPHSTDAGFEQVIARVDVVSLPVLDYTDMWWAGVAENGWGVSITQHGNIQFIVLYVYDASGNPTWVVMPTGTWNAAQTAYSGALYRPSGSLFSAYNVQSFKANAPVGTATVTYTGPGTATLSYTIDGISGSKNIQRQIYATDDGLPKLTVNDLWWGGDTQNGWGLNIAQQGRVLFPVWYTYDASGKTMWYAIPGGIWDGSTFTGDLYATTSSPWLGVPYNAAAFTPVKVGGVVLTFIDQDNATMTYTVNGVTQTKSIVRQPY